MGLHLPVCLSLGGVAVDAETIGCRPRDTEAVKTRLASTLVIREYVAVQRGTWCPLKSSVLATDQFE